MNYSLKLTLTLICSSFCMSILGQAGIGTRGTGFIEAPAPNTFDNMLFQRAELNYENLYKNNGALLKSILIEYLTQNQLTFDTTLKIENQVVNSFADWSSINAQRILNQADEVNWELSSPVDTIPGPTNFIYEEDRQVISISCTETNCQAPLNPADVTSSLAYFMTAVTDAPFTEGQIKQEIYPVVDSIMRARNLKATQN
ncbi:MAG: hypothetical protein R3A80_02035 [Bdellovibrionota bacterium]